MFHVYKLAHQQESLQVIQIKTLHRCNNVPLP